MSRILFAFGFLLCLSLIMSGCASSHAGPGLVVGNATERAFKAARIRSAATSYAFGPVEAFSVSEPQKRLSALSESVSVEWESEGGTKGVKSVSLGPSLREYPGRIQFQVDARGVVKVFTAPIETGGDSVLPWSLPANWEGTPSIPGMTQ